MPTLADYQSQPTAWCPHCGNFGILQAVKQALIGLGREPWEVALFSGIGQAAKLPQYLRCNYFNGLHGRALPPATAAAAVRPDLTVLVTTGDGDCYGEGGNHFLHALRRNPDLTIIVHDNQVYGLTKGQASPTSEAEFVTRTQPTGPHDERFNPLALAVLLRAPFVARGYARELVGLADLIAQGIQHRGLALIDVLQPCVTFNRLNTDEWYERRIYQLGDDYDPSDRAAALAKAEEWGERIPLGVIYRCERPVFTEDMPAAHAGPPALRQRSPQEAEGLLEEFI
jgi:2-oxoglutarate ferredoxin oxidoreductase subunit beta